MALILIIAVVVGIVIFINNQRYNYELSEIQDGEFQYYKLEKDGKYGVIDRNGNVIIEPTYASIDIPNPTVGLFIKSDDNQNYSAINENGEDILTEYDSVEAISINSITSNVPYEKSVLKYKQNNLYGLIDFEGNKITENIYNSITNIDYKEGNLKVEQNGSYGVINIKGTNMKLIVGLGNIGDKYCMTRHNAGFMVLDRWTLTEGLSFKNEGKLKAYLSKIRYNGEDILFAKPTTFMNLSGEAVRAIMDYYKIDLKDILIIYDDISLDLGRIRYRANGSDGGHNGIKSIIKHTGSKDFARLKIGIGPQPNIPSENYVLQNFPKEQLDELKEVLDRAIESVKFYLDNGIEKTQNKYN